jgi:HD superfamily phosphohydrolase
MARKIIKMTQSEFDVITDTLKSVSSSKNHIEQQYWVTKARLDEANAQIINQSNELGYLKALFDKEADTQVIKYNGKLYRITSTTNYVEAGVEETLDLTAVLVREVG